jgi:hypothetical protein
MQPDVGRVWYKTYVGPDVKLHRRAQASRKQTEANTSVSTDRYQRNRNAAATSWRLTKVLVFPPMLCAGDKVNWSELWPVCLRLLVPLLLSLTSISFFRLNIPG